MDNSEIIDQLRAEVITAAVNLFEGNEEAAMAWLNRPLRAIGYEKPVDYMTSTEELQRLRDVIGQLEHGVWI